MSSNSQNANTAPASSSGQEDKFGLERFVQGQNGNNWQGSFKEALEELKNGRKQSHWTWYVFPQIAGFSQSSTSVRYAIQSEEEASAYLAHPVLGQRLLRASQAVVDASTKSVRKLMGSVTDAQKLQSSMTLFARVSDEEVFGWVLDKYYGGEEDEATIEKLQALAEDEDDDEDEDKDEDENKDEPQASKDIAMK